MDSPLQKAPSGLLGLFDLKTQGKQPDKFADRVQPTFEVLQTYVPLSIQSRALDIELGALFAADTWDVPTGEVWIVRGLGYLGEPTVADIAKNFFVHFSINDGLNQVGLQNTNPPTNNAQIRAGATFLSGQPLLVRAGWGLLTRVDLSAAATAAIPGFMSILYQRIVE